VAALGAVVSTEIGCYAHAHYRRQYCFDFFHDYYCTAMMFRIFYFAGHGHHTALIREFQTSCFSIEYRAEYFEASLLISVNTHNYDGLHIAKTFSDALHCTDGCGSAFTFKFPSRHVFCRILHALLRSD
jgi:hypothetical protein